MTAPTTELINILLVDDKPENLIALEELLRSPERRLFSAASGNDALRLLLRHEFAVVLLDVEMPGMDGYETAQLMRSVERTQLIPIIFVTAGDRSEERTFRGYEVGAVDFLYKPITPFTLRCKVDGFVALYRKTQELAACNVALEYTTTALHDRVADLEHVTRTLSHDLRAPLRSIHGFSTALAEELAGSLPPAADHHLNRILNAALRMGRMLDDLYSLLQVSAAGEARGEVSTEDVLAGVLDSLRSDITASGAQITHDALPELYSNRVLLAQILQNLIANALKFHGADPPRIHVTASATSGAWQLAVVDHGPGIRAEDRERVFGVFERATGGDAVPGTGVGLALCKRAVAKLGGRIWIEATSGGGATFCFTVPASAR